MMIRAKGTKNGKRMVVEYADGEYVFDGKTNYGLEAEIVMELRERHPIGGTYYTEKEDDPVNIENVLGNWFFDKPTLEIETDYDFQLPYEKGRIY